MKKLLYILTIVTVLAGSFTACTDENVQPTANEGGSGGFGTDPKN